MKTMSDFIMEQEASTSGYDNDMEIMESFMQVSAIGAVAECYCEHAAIAEFATESGLNVFTESDDNIMKKAWNATKEFFNKIWEWLKSVVRGVINFFTKSSVDRLIVKLKEYEKEDFKNVDSKGTAYLKNISISKLDASGVLNLVEEFSTAIRKGGEASNSDAIKGFIDRAENYLKSDTIKEKFGKYDYDAEPKEGEAPGTSIRAVIALLERMSKMDVPSSGRKLLKKLDFDKENYKKGGTGDDKDKIDKDLVKSIKKAANLVAKAYDEYVSNTVKLVNKALKKNIKGEDLKEIGKAEKAEYEKLDKSRSGYTLGKESYEENTDGYYFL